MSGRVLVLEDDDSLRLVISKALSRAGFDVRATASPQTAVDRMAAGEADALVADVLLGRENFLERLNEIVSVRPGAPVVVISAQTTAATAIRAAKGGAFEYLPKPFDLNELVDLLSRALKAPDAGVRATKGGYGGLVGRSPAMQAAFRSVGRLARRSDPVLILGPEGSGRAAMAGVIWTESGAAGALRQAGPEALKDEPSLLARREGGLLLRRAESWDERTQGRVLERLESGEGARLLVTASPEAAERLGRGLLDRLAVGLIDCPPVRRRGEDRALLFRHFLQIAGGGAFSLTEAGEAFVNAQAWAGEVLEIKRTAERIAAQGVRGDVGPEEIADAMASPRAPDAEDLLEDAAARFFAAFQGGDGLAERGQAAVERGLMRAALEASGGVRQEAARRLGMNRNTFARRLDQLGLGGDDAV